MISTTPLTMYCENDCTPSWELSLGLWMTFKGFRKEAPLMLEATAEAASPDWSATVTRSSIGVASKAGGA